MGLEVLGAKWAEKTWKHRDKSVTEMRGMEQRLEERTNPVRSAFIYKVEEIIVDLCAGKNGSQTENDYHVRRVELLDEFL